MNNIKLFVLKDQQVVAYALAVRCYRVLHICDIFVSEPFRNHGIGTMMLLCFAEIFKSCTWVKLDDCTGRIGSANNIYVKSGFVYENSYEPEMIARLSYVRIVLKKKIDKVHFTFNSK